MRYDLERPRRQARRLMPDHRRPVVQFRRLTDSGGADESPSISPDGKMVVFVAPHEAGATSGLHRWWLPFDHA